MLNLVRRSHRNVFVELIEEQLDVYKLENELNEMMKSTIYHQIETVDIIIIKIINTATKKVEGMKRNVPYSNEKKRCRASLLYSKIQLRKCKGIVVDEDIMKKRQNEAQLLGIEYDTIKDTEAAVAKTKEE